MPNAILTDKDRVRLNRHLQDLNLIKDDIETMKRAGISGAERLEDKCNECINKIVKIKEAYFPSKP